MINRIHIENFKCLRDTVINFRNITVLAGSNSVGKSSVIQAFLLSKITLDKLANYNILDNDFKGENRIKIPLNGKYILNLGNTREVLSRDVNSNVISFSLIDNEESSIMKLEFIAEDVRNDFYDLELNYPL